MKEQLVLYSNNNYSELDNYLERNKIKKIFLVCGNSIKLLNINLYFNLLYTRKGIEIIRFMDFQPNPQYSSVVNGIRSFNKAGCDLIVAVGGGSAIDVAKCIKLFAGEDTKENFFQQKAVSNDIKFLAIPTTAGSGSESTQYAVVYYEGEKQSISNHMCIPSAILFDVGVLTSLPLYQKKSAMLDALCHAIESFWSVNSTKESLEYSKKAIRIILENYKLYLANNVNSNKEMLIAANIAGKAINIAQTTAGHAMSYKMTSLYGISHGHAAALCLTHLWFYMINHQKNCIDKRGIYYFINVLEQLSHVFGCRTPMEAAIKFKNIVNSLELEIPKANKNDFEVLVSSVNKVRLKNNPVYLDKSEIDILYHEILERVINI